MSCTVEGSSGEGLLNDASVVATYSSNSRVSSTGTSARTPAATLSCQTVNSVTGHGVVVCVGLHFRRGVFFSGSLGIRAPMLTGFHDVIFCCSLAKLRQ